MLPCQASAVFYGMGILNMMAVGLPMHLRFFPYLFGLPRLSGIATVLYIPRGNLCDHSRSTMSVLCSFGVTMRHVSHSLRKMALRFTLRSGIPYALH